MIGYKQPMLAAKALMVRQDFDFVHETDRTTVWGQVKMPSLSDYDHDGYDGEDTDIILGLIRWGDLQFPERLNHKTDYHIWPIGRLT